MLKQTPAVLSDKQLEYFATSDAFINVADGPVRSGKTHACLVRFAEHCLRGPAGELLIVAKTQRTAHMNVIAPLEEMARGQFRVKYSAGSGILYVGDRRVWVVGANDEGAEGKIRGMTAAGAYCNEAALYPSNVWKQILARNSSVEGAQIFGDTNPDSPYHYLLKEYLGNELLLEHDLNRYRYTLDDNPSLTEQQKARLRRLYTGLWYKRMILGLWVMAEGAIYDMFEEGVHTTPHWPTGFSKVIVGADYGTANATAFLMLGKRIDDGRWIVFREYYYDARAKGRQKTNAEYAEDLKTFLKGDGYPDPFGELYPQSIELDPSAASFRVECKSRGINRVRLAENEVVPGIQTVSSAFSTEQLVIHESCENTIKEAMSYVWDPKAQEKGEDKPLKEGAQDHALDGLRYGVMRAIGKKGLALVATA